MCGRIEVTNKSGKAKQSSVFCSGEVKAKSTAQVSFSIPAVNTLCIASGGNWTEECSFTFLPEKP